MMKLAQKFKKLTDLKIELARIKEILIQQTQNNNYVNNEPSLSSSPSNSDTHYRKDLIV